jgi:tetratricopeptide (TPR) repeat protein
LFAKITFICLISIGSAFAADDARSERILAAQRSGDYAEAGKLYLQLIASGTDSPEIRSNCGIMLHLAGKNREALQQFRIVLAKEPAMPSANLFAGLSEFDLGDMKASRAYLEKAAVLDPGRPAPFLALGKVYVALGNYRSANESFARAVQLDSRLAEAWYGLGITDRSLAKEILDRIARTSEVRTEADKDKVQGLLDKAVEALTRATELDPNSARTHLMMAESLADSGKLVEAVPEYQAAVKLDPKMDAAYIALASAYWKQRQFDQATPVLRQVLAKWPADAEANTMMADIMEHNNDLNGAQTHAEAALRVNHGLAQAHVVLARVYLAKQQPKLAASELQKITGADPDGSYHFLLYRACRAAGDQGCASKAIAEFQRLRYPTPN